MRSNKKWLQDAKLYLILDAQVNDHAALLEILRDSVDAGVDIVQLRDKAGSARSILKFSEKAMKITNGKIPFILNDRVDLAMIAKVSGVHLGQEDISLKAARKMMGERAMIGLSCQTLEHARRAQGEGADYIGFGSIFKTQTKPGRSPMNLKVLQKVIRDIKIPVFAIGGITTENIRQLRDLSVERIAVCRDICESDDVPKKVRAIRSDLNGERNYADG